MPIPSWLFYVVIGVMFVIILYFVSIVVLSLVGNFINFISNLWKKFQKKPEEIPKKTRKSIKRKKATKTIRRKKATKTTRRKKTRKSIDQKAKKSV